MAYDVSKLVNLGHLKTVLTNTNDTFATKTALNEIDSRVDELTTAGGEPNVITSIKVNGIAQPISSKSVNITVPTKVSALTNDSEFQTKANVNTAITTAIAGLSTLSFKKVTELPAVGAAESNVIYLYKNATTGHYDLYAKVEGETELQLLDDTTVNLDAYVKIADTTSLLEPYAKTVDINTELTNKVDVVSGKGLSTNDYTTTEKNKLAGVKTGANKVEASTNGKIKIDGVDTTVYTLPSNVIQGAIAADSEITDLLTEIFGA